MSQQPNMIMQLLPMVVIFGIFYFLVIRPEKKKQKDHKDLLTALTKNDKVITAGGMHGVIVNVKEKTVVVRVDEGCRIELTKESISTVVEKADTK